MKPKNIKNIIFDLGGVLIDWNPRYLYNRLLNYDHQKIDHFLTNICTQEWNEEQDRGRSFDEGVAILTSKHPEFADLIQAYHLNWHEMLGGVFQETVEILDLLRKANYRIFALTNWSKEKFPLALKKFEFLSWFENILVSGEVNLKKPDPEIYQLMFKRFNLIPETSLFIDDSPKNIAASELIGMPGIIFESGKQLRKALRDFDINI